MAGSHSLYSTTPSTTAPSWSFARTSDAIDAGNLKTLRFNSVDIIHYPESIQESPRGSDASSLKISDSARRAQLTESSEAQKHEPLTTGKVSSKKGGKQKQDICGRKRLSRWITISLVFLSVSTIIFLVAFVTNGWGTLLVRLPTRQATTESWNRSTDFHSPTFSISQLMHPIATTKSEVPSEEESKDTWHFGLWQFCRKSDGICVGPRWPPFYSATRAFCVLALFGHCLGLAWLIGNSIEQLLSYDVCTLATIATFCFSSASFVLIAVCFFGIRWPVDFKDEYYGTQPTLSFSFYIACASVITTLAAGVFIVVDICTSLSKIKNRKRYHTNIDDQMLDDAFDEIDGYGATTAYNRNDDNNLEMTNFLV